MLVYLCPLILKYTLLVCILESYSPWTLAFLCIFRLPIFVKLTLSTIAECNRENHTLDINTPDDNLH